MAAPRFVVVAFCVALPLLSIEADELFVAPALDCAFMSLACAGWLLVLDCGLAGSDGVFAAAAALLSWALVDASIFWVALVEASVCVALVVALVEASIFCVPFVLVEGPGDVSPGHEVSDADLKAVLEEDCQG